MKLIIASALVLALSLPALASDEGIVITSTMKVVLGRGGRIVGPFAVYGSNGEKIFDVPAGSSVDSELPMTTSGSGTLNCCIAPSFKTN